MPAVRDRVPALLALAIPVFAGIAWMSATGAPAHYPLVNLGALALALGWICVGHAPAATLPARIVVPVLLAIMFAPLVLGPERTSVTDDTVHRWLAMGPILVTTGMLAGPALVVLAARNRVLAAPILLAGIFAALLQPDGATGFAITFAAIGVHHVGRDWKVGVTCIVGFVASVTMTLRGELAPREFVERVLIDAAHANLWPGAVLALALTASFFLMLFAAPLARIERFALAGALFGFTVIAMMSHYPSALIGYGAAPILGFGLALGLGERKRGDA